MEDKLDIEKNSVLDEENAEIMFISAENKLPDVDEVIKLISEKKIKEFRELISGVPSPDIAELFEEIPEEQRVLFYRFLPKDLAADVFVEMDYEMAEELITSFTDGELSEVLASLSLDDTVDIIEEMPAVVVKRIIKNSSEENRKVINQLLRYPKDSAGTIMTTEYVKLLPDMTVKASLQHIRDVAIDKETIYTCYVTDEKRRLLGIVTARRLMLSPLDMTLSEIMEESVIFALTTEDKEDVANKFDKYGFIALPVVDNEHRLVGIVTVDDAIEVLREEAEEDFAKMAAIIPSESEYLKTSAFDIFKSRIPWLLLLMISATVSSAILKYFEASLIPVLVLFVPMLMDTGGNSGSQASVTAIRGLSTGEVALSDVFRILWKEIRVGALCGFSLAVVAFAKVVIVDRFIMQNEAVTLIVALAVSLALFATIVVAKIIGSTLPLLAKRIGFDPAVMASPFITTIVDAIGLMVYFAISAYAFGLTI